MGLDMYLKKREYISPFWTSDHEYKPVKRVSIIVDQKFEDGTIEQRMFELKNFASGIEINTPYAYWRKANAIHRWFVDNFADGHDDCRSIYVTGEHLLDLVETCKKVLKDHTKAEELLPTQDGFFFGNTEYDDWYLDELENTIDQLKDVKPDDEFIYQASW